MKHIKLKIIICTLIVAVAAVIINAVYCTETFGTTSYSVENNKSNAKLKFVLISDLHNKEFGNDNQKLINAVKEENPDFIAVTGDMVTRWSADDSVMKSVLSQLSETAPTYCCLGNHERDLADKIDFKTDINSTGAVLLDNEYIEFEKDGETLLIGGLSDFPYYEDGAPDYDNAERYFWDDFKEKSKDQFSILLHHQPEYVASILTGSNIDLVVCGHTHGGLVRLPFVGGVISPNQGLFPKYDKGEYYFGSTEIIITSGLGNSYPLPRINNRAEICAIKVN